uniref:Uncharacterized protein LOC104229884 n=1 Tax=Nicotiana sylvestris TaxID=4096 RepID=A0A1U7WUD5_NICSY|nr:PREDICTED: uncharacterized protein LOC104229884 [Nicotiana sylvestris]
MKLNPEKSAFRVGSGKFLSFMVSNRGIEINPDKIKAIKNITVVDNVKVVQRLNKRIASQGRFILRSSDKSHRFFSLLKKKNNFTWTSECQRAFKELKRYLSRPPLLHTPKSYEQLYLYLAVSKIAHVPRDQNSKANALANLGSSVEDDDLKSRVVVQLMRLVVEEGHAEINSTSLTWDWRNKYIEYLKTGKVPSDPKESRALCTKAAQFSLSKDGTLFRRMFDGLLAICLGPGDTKDILRKVHEGTCGNHSGPESLVRKVYEKVREKEVTDFIWDHIICRFGCHPKSFVTTRNSLSVAK